MKKILFAVAMILVFAQGRAFAVPLFNAYGTLFTEEYTLASAVTATGTGSAVSFSFIGDNAYHSVHMITEQNIPISKHGCTATWGGSGNPTQIVFSIDGSTKNNPASTDFAAIASVTMTASPTVIHIDKPGLIWIRRTLISFTGGTTPTFTLTCTSGGI